MLQPHQYASVEEVENLWCQGPESRGTRPQNSIHNIDFLPLYKVIRVQYGINSCNSIEYEMALNTAPLAAKAAISTTYVITEPIAFFCAMV